MQVKFEDLIEKQLNSYVGILLSPSMHLKSFCTIVQNGM